MQTMLVMCALLFADDGGKLLQLNDSELGTMLEVVAQMPDQAKKELPEGKVSQEQGELYLRLQLVNDETKDLGLPLLGHYERRGERLIFHNRYALESNRTYRATLQLQGKFSTQLDYLVPKRPATKVAEVEKVYPSATELPANLLKFYIHFSKPMREGKDIFDHVHILDDQGKEIGQPWRRMELWAADAKRLSLYIHPGRIKQGVNLREELGGVLEPQRKYTLVIDAELLDADGQKLGKPFTKTFTTTVEDRGRPLPRQWKLSAPVAGTRQPLALDFGEALDRHQLERYLKVWDSDSRPVAGKIEVGSLERIWRFTPDAPWNDQRHVLTVEEVLEDLAGNTPERLFDTDLLEPTLETPILAVPFLPAAPAQ